MGVLIAAFFVSQAIAGHSIPVLIALAAGVTVRNVDRRMRGAPSSELKHARFRLCRFLPAGPTWAHALAEMWPWALLLVGYGSMGCVGDSAGAGGRVRLREVRLAGLVSQGGLAITLAALAAAPFPE